MAFAAVTGVTEIRIIASGGFKAACLELISAFERANGHRVATTWAGSVNIMKRMHAGERFDLVIMPSTSIDELIKTDKVVSGSRVDVAKSGIGVAVREGAPKPSISSSEALKHALLAAGSISYSTSASGISFKSPLRAPRDCRHAKAKDQAKSARGPGRRAGGAWGSRNRLPTNQRASSSNRHRLPWAAPGGIQHYTTFSAGLHTGAKEPGAAKELISFLKGPSAAPVVTKFGMEPA